MKRLLFGIFLLYLSGCSSYTHTKASADLIPMDSMVQVLVDIHVADAVVEQRSGTQNNNIPLTSALYQQVYRNHHITAEQYKASYKYYEADPPLMDKMYELVITELSKKEVQVNK